MPRRARDAGEDLEQLADRKAARAAAAGRDRSAGDRFREQQDLQQRAAAAGEDLLRDVLQVPYLAQSTVRRADATARDIAAVDRFAFDDSVEEQALEA